MRARAILVLGLLLALPGQSSAATGDDDFAIEVPAGFSERPDIAKRLAATAGFEGSEPGARAYVAEAGGAALYVSWADGDAAAENPAAVAEKILTDVRAAPDAASPEAGSTQTSKWALTEGERFLDARHVWRHLSNETTTLTRALVYADAAGAVHMVRVDCVIASDALATFEPVCQKALASLSLTTAADTRQRIAPMAIAAPGEKRAMIADTALEASPGTGAGAGAAKGGTLYANPDAGSGAFPWWLIIVAGGGLAIGGAVLAIRRKRTAQETTDGA